MENKYWLGLPGLLALMPGCAGRLVAMPTTPAGYQHVDARDVAPVGMHDMNVEITTTLGPMLTSEACDGYVTFPLPEAAPQIANADAIELVGKSNLVLTIPRARYGEVRDLRANDRVRVRGYLATSLANDCGFESGNARRYLWIDSITRVGAVPADAPPAPGATEPAPRG